MNTFHKIIFGDARNMSRIKNESIHLIITSPPYWQLKDYGSNEQIGYNDTYEEYINNLNLVWEEAYRVLHKGCRLCINIGDQFARSVYYGRYKIIPIRTEIIKFCETIGFDYMGAIIWQKVTTCNTSGGATVMGSYPYPRNGILKLDYEFILIFKKPGNAPKVPKDIKEKSKLTKEEWNQYFSGHWNFPGEKQDKHLAMFPVELPYRLIKMFSFVGDTVLDPFVGSGTTSLAAKLLQRNSIGYEINHDYLPIIKEKFNSHCDDKTYNAHLEFITDKNDKIDYNERIKKLPYIFKDPVKIDKKVDPKKLNFGSKIDGTSESNINFLGVKKIISPEMLILDNNLTIKLLGIKENIQNKQKAIEFLNNMLIGKKVFLKFDTKKFDENGNLLCYLYLKNKTFINGHLVKSNLVDVDTTIEYKYKNKFIKYRGAHDVKRVDIESGNEQVGAK
ncbi:DNA methyltransferase [Calorimonas adulescens]|uniref:Methyltransferase n=1 Tax=Calorimonas adulescens TaxID=2606906 RepID=A0A5D8Q9U2_9THEO|nr:DNA methyltransferase [Calorimonas adulescens]TZE81147.1 site-specific DNA-methyltransferase [Calorimonas adulescens]